MKHPALQNQNRMHELADELCNIRGDFAVAVAQQEKYSRAADDLCSARTQLAELRADAQKLFQSLCETTYLTENGLPAGMTLVDWNLKLQRLRELRTKCYERVRGYRL